MIGCLGTISKFALKEGWVLEIHQWFLREKVKVYIGMWKINQNPVMEKTDFTPFYCTLLTLWHVQFSINIIVSIESLKDILNFGAEGLFSFESRGSVHNRPKHCDLFALNFKKVSRVVISSRSNRSCYEYNTLQSSRLVLKMYPPFSPGFHSLLSGA